MNANLVAAIKHFFFAGVGVLLVFLTGSGCRKASAPQQGPLPVNVVTVVEKEVNEWDEFTGRLDPVESVEIRPRVSGYITEIHFEAGAIVKKGDLLYVIDPRPYQADFDRAAAEVDRNGRATQACRDRTKPGEGTARQGHDFRQRVRSEGRYISRCSCCQKFGRSRQECGGAKSGVHANQISDRRPSE
jgi:multidrug efflux pump subunit AcrA (membrane-fusion protein)